jgi:glycosyltransferase involved in cell wall biosynthesis
MNEPLVSVVTVACNVDRFFAESIESILGQTFRDFEFIIVDYGSTDNSKAIAMGYAAKDSRIRFHEIPNCVLPAARNAACSLGRGRYIAIMDADDVCLPDRLKLEVEFMEQNPEVGLMGGAVEWVDGTGRSLGQQAHPSEDLEIRSVLLDHCPFWHPTVLLRKEAFTSVGGYRAAFVAAHDYDLELRIVERYKCANLRQVVLKYRLHPGQVSMQKQKQQTLGSLAAQWSRAMRQKGQEDVFDSVVLITPELLTELGVDESTYERTWVSESRRRIRYMISSGETSAALDMAVELLHGNWVHAEKWQIADLHLTVAGLRWKRGEFSESIRSAARAVRVRPKVLGRPVRPWLKRIGLVDEK